MTAAIDEYVGEKWEYLQVHDESPAAMMDSEVLNKWGEQGWQLCMAYAVQTPVAVISGAAIDPSRIQMRQSRVYVYKRPVKSVRP